MKLEMNHAYDQPICRCIKYTHTIHYSLLCKGLYKWPDYYGFWSYSHYTR